MMAALRSGDWDIIVSDHRMPQFDAPSALAVLQESGRDIPFIVVSGSIGEDAAVSMMKAGAHDYIMKNNLARLLPAVQREMREVEMRRERRRTEERLSRLNECLLSFGADSGENIDRLVMLCGEQLDGDFAMYTRMVEGELHAVGTWNLPADSFFTNIVSACEGLLGDASKDVRVVPDLSQEGDVQGDLELQRHGIRTYIGRSVVSEGARAGALCVFYRGDRLVRNEEKEFLGIVASAIRVEEKRREAEAALRKSEEKYRSLVENSTDLVLRFDRKNRHIFLSPSVADISTLKPVEMLGKSHRELNFPVDQCLFWEKAIQSVFETGQRVAAEIRVSGRSGPVDLNVHLFPEFGEGGRIVSVVGVARDVTREKSVEAQLRHAQKMEAIGTLAGGIAHDFNNLLQAVQGYADILLLRKKEKDAGFRELSEIGRAAARGGELTRQLLAFSRKMESKLESTDLNSTIGRLQNMMDRTIPKMIRIELKLSEQLWHINADPSQMEQVLMNLVLNSRDAMPGGGRIVISTENAVIGHEDRRLPPELPPGSYVRLTVSDTGHGMDRETLQNIFDPFFTTKEVGKGTGLGLAMVYGILKNHDGYIFCDSAVGSGTTFTIYLPAMENAASRGESSERWRPRGGNETILLVDDEAFIRDVGENILSSFGYRVLGASSGESALEVYRRQGHEIGLVILDLIMPGMDGRECLARLLELDPAVKVVFTSGYAVGELTNDILKSGARSFIYKPYRIEQILETIRSVLDEAGKGEQSPGPRARKTP